MASTDMQPRGVSMPTIFRPLCLVEVCSGVVDSHPCSVNRLSSCFVAIAGAPILVQPAVYSSGYHTGGSGYGGGYGQNAYGQNGFGNGIGVIQG